VNRYLAVVVRSVSGEEDFGMVRLKQTGGDCP